jgi:hypothetical protein
MNNLGRAAGAAIFMLAAFGGAGAARAGECVNDWPTPDECFPDVLCPHYAEYWDLRRAVVHLYGPDIVGTGVLINNADCHFFERNCGAPYLLTANHIVSGQLGVQMSNGEMSNIQTQTSFTFGFEAALCGGAVSGGAVAVEGATIVAHSPGTDLLLLKLATSLPPELGAFFVGWCETPFDQAIAIGHPCGAPKRIAISEPGEIASEQTISRDVYDVYWWEEGALAGGSSGSPLLDAQSGALKGIFTNTVQAGSLACSQPGVTPSQDRFTALSSILAVLPTSVDGGSHCVDHYDANAGAPILGTVEDSSYYGPGEIRVISAGHEVLLVDGFFADKGSNITIEIKP